MAGHTLTQSIATKWLSNKTIFAYMVIVSAMVGVRF